MDFLSISGLVLTIPNIVFIALSQLYFWQRKEYRLDRVWSTWFDKQLTVKDLLLPLGVAVLFMISYQLSSAAAAIATQLLIFAFYAWRLLTHGLYRPRLTAKIELAGWLVIAGVGLHLPFFWLNPGNLAVRQTALVLLALPLTIIAVGVVNLLTKIKQRAVINQAKQLRQSLPSLTVVGVTGSHGKTTTKQFLADIVPAAVASAERRNSDYVIALDMLKQLNSNTSYYIVEMGAYKQGEIASLADLTHPFVGLLTHIGSQHLALFGSKEKLLAAKWELITSLPKDGIAVLNFDDKIIRQKAKTYPGKIIWYSKRGKADVWANNIKIEPTRLSLTLQLKAGSYPLSVNLLSEAYLDSIIAAAAAAYSLGTAGADIARGIQRLQPISRNMELRDGPGGAKIIDDSYSASEQAVHNALKHLQRFTQPDKRVVMVPLIELGARSSAIHHLIGQQLNKAKVKTYVYGQARQKELGQTVFTTPQKLVKALTNNVTADTVILLEGRVPDIVRQSLIV